jgi:hypothetical protein
MRRLMSHSASAARSELSKLLELYLQLERAAGGHGKLNTLSEEEWALVCMAQELSKVQGRPLLENSEKCEEEVRLEQELDRLTCLLCSCRRPYNKQQTM